YFHNDKFLVVVKMKDDRTTIYMDDTNNYYVDPTNDDRLFAMLIYVTSFFTVIIGPLLLWLLKRESSRFIDFHGKQYFNFIITYFIYSSIAFILQILVIGFLLLPIVGFFVVVFTIVGAIKAF